MIHIIFLLSLEALVLVSLVSRKWEYLVKNFLSMKSSSLNLDEMSIYTNKESWGQDVRKQLLTSQKAFFQVKIFLFDYEVPLALEFRKLRSSCIGQEILVAH
ncbi:hypothetical protein QL285_028908 [Trifolium repens]|nr:hypothetical protein QL285_028908 [Trifolium repens]